MTELPGVGVTAVTVSGLPARIIGGQKSAKAKVSVLISNNTATLATGAAVVSVVASTDGIVDTADLPLGSVTKKLKLKPGQSKAVKVSAKFPSVPADADYQLLASATIAGADGGSAAAPAPVHVEKPVVDLTVPPGTTAGTVHFGEPIKLPLPLVNSGNVTAKGTIDLELVVSATGSLDAGVSFPLTTLPGVKVSIKPGTTRPVKLPITFPATFPSPFAAGDYFLAVRITASSLGTPNATDNVVVANIPFQILE